MAEDKKGVLVYADWIEHFEALEDDEAGQLIKHFFRYINDKNPEYPNRIIQIAFNPIKSVLKRDLEKWVSKKEKSSENGRIGNLKKYHSDLYIKYLNKEMTLEHAENLAKSRKPSLPDSDPTKNVAKLAVIDSVSVIVSDIDTSTNVDDEKEKFDDDFQNFKILFYKNLSDDFDFTFEIQKIKNQLDEEKPEQEKIFLSQQLNFLISEKRKKVAPKKENKHLEFIEELKKSIDWLDLVSMQNKNIPIEVIIVKLNEFNDHLKTDLKIHSSKSDFTSHFKNWLPKKIPEKKTELQHNR